MKTVKLNQIGMGALEELFQEELEKIVQNIHDLRTKPDAIREINIKLKFRPSKENRGLATLETTVSSKLAPVPHATQVLSGVTRNGIEITEPDLTMKDTQLAMFKEAE